MPTTSTPTDVLKQLRATGLPHGEPPNWQHASLIWALESGFARHTGTCAKPCSCGYDDWLRDIEQRWTEETTPTEDEERK